MVPPPQNEHPVTGASESAQPTHSSSSAPQRQPYPLYYPNHHHHNPYYVSTADHHAAIAYHQQLYASMDADHTREIQRLTKELDDAKRTKNKSSGGCSEEEETIDDRRLGDGVAAQLQASLFTTATNSELKRGQHHLANNSACDASLEHGMNGVLLGPNDDKTSDELLYNALVEITRLKQQNEKLEATLTRKNYLLRKHQERDASRQDELTKLRDEEKKYKDQIAGLVARSAEKECKAAAEHKRAIEKLKETHKDDLEKSLADQRAHQDALLGQVNHLKQDNDTLEAILARKDYLLQKHQTRDASRFAELNKLREKEKKYKDRISTLSECVEKHREANAKRKREVAELKEHAKKKKLGLPVTKHDEKWQAHYEELKVFSQKYGHCIPTNREFQDKKYDDLIKWVGRQRAAYAAVCEGRPFNGARSLTPARIKLLNQLGFEWKSSLQMTWDERFLQLVDYQREHGHTRVPQGPGLGHWVLDQRKAYKHLGGPDYKNNYLTEERVRKLDELGFEWSLKNMGKRESTSIAGRAGSPPFRDATEY